MTTYNTGNPVPSKDPRDLLDNAENADLLENGPNPSYPDRLGVSRKSRAGMESDFATDQSERATTFANFLASSGYVGTGTGGAIEDYAGGIQITAYNQIIRESGEFYRAKASLSLPYTTTGTWVGDDETRFVPVGDAALRQEIGSGIFRADSLANLESTNGRFDGDAARLVSGTGRDGDFRWNASDLSATLVLASATSDSVDDTTDTINDADHPFADGMGVIAQTAVNGLTAQTVYWVVNSTSGTYQLSADYNGSPVDLTGTANVAIDKLLDPLQGIYITPTVDKTGASGAWVRRHDGISSSGGVFIEYFGADNSGIVASDSSVNAAISYGRPKRIAVLAGPGFFTIEKGIDLVQAGDISGDSLLMEFKGAGRYATYFCSRNAPAYVFKIDGRFSTLSGVSVMGSIDDIRDADNSAAIGIWAKNMRVGGLSNFRISHIVGAGLQIDKCIISNVFDGIIYRCGSDSVPALYQSDASQDGFQASSMNNVNVEDSQGIGAFSFLSHRNSEFDHITIEQQPYHIVELSSPSGQFLVGESLTFSGGATGTVGLSSKAAANYQNGNGEVVVESLSGSIAASETVTSSGGASGTVKAVTNGGVQQFKTAGQYGKFGAIYCNKNELFTGTNNVDIVGSENEFELLKLRGKHVNRGVRIAGNLNNFTVLDIEQGLTDIADEALYDEALNVVGFRNNIGVLETLNSKSVILSGQRNTVDKLTQRELYGASLSVTADYSGVDIIDSIQASYTDAGGVLDGPLCALSGKDTFVSSGSVSWPNSGTDGFQLAGEGAYVGDVRVLDIGAANNVGRTTSSGINASFEGTRVEIANSSTEGFRLTGVGSKVDGAIINGGGVSIFMIETGTEAKNCKLSGYETRGIAVQPASTKTRIRLQDNSLFSPGVGAIDDINVNNDVTFSHFTNNNGNDGTGTSVFGIGTGNVESGNI